MIQFLIFTSAAGLCSLLPSVFGIPGGLHLQHQSSHESHAPLAHNHIADYYATPRYSYSYGVDDPHTHDQKSAYETRDGDYTHGRYSVMQPDGVLRVVTYTADPWRGFQAEVKMLNGYAHHPPHHYYSPKPIVAIPVVPIPKRQHPHPHIVKNVIVKTKIPVVSPDYIDNGHGYGSSGGSGQGQGGQGDYY